jgi:hypothetical protein
MVARAFVAALVVACSEETAQAAVACDGPTVLSLGGCPASGGCNMVGDLDLVCDASCGAECVYDFGAMENTGMVHAFRGPRFVSTGPPMRFVGDHLWFFSSGGDFGTGSGSPFTSVPGVEGPPGGTVTFVGSHLAIGRPIRVPGGTVIIDVGGFLSGEVLDPSKAQVDVSGPIGGGTIRILRGSFWDATLLARGLSSTAPGGTVSLESRYPSILNQPHLIDVSGASGGTVAVGPITYTERSGIRLLARGRNGDGGLIDIDATGLPSSQEIWMANCNDRLNPRIRVDGRGGKGGTLNVRTQSYVQFCSPVLASGDKGGGTVIVEAGADIRMRTIKARGRDGSPGGVIQLTAQTGSAFTDRVSDVSGAPGGQIDMRANVSAGSARLNANATRDRAAAGTIYVGEQTDPPEPITTPGFIVATARSLEGPGGSITVRGCRSSVSTLLDASGGARSTGGQVLYQFRQDVVLPDKIRATGPGGSIRVEYVTSVSGGGDSIPAPELFQYPNPACDCTMTLAQCMTPP